MNSLNFYLPTIPSNLSSFIWTELQSEDKPLTLTIADKILLTPWNYNFISSTGLPQKRKYKQKVFKTTFLVSSIGIGIFATLKAAGGVITTPISFSALLSFTVVYVAAKALHEKLGNFIITRTSRNLLIATISIAALCILMLSGIALLAHGLTTSMVMAIIESNLTPLMNLIKLFAFNFFAGAALKLLVYKTYPKVPKSLR